MDIDEKNRIKHPRLVIFIVIIAVLLFPIRFDSYDAQTGEGGTQYRSLIYTAEKKHEPATMEGMQGCNSGWVVNVLWFEVYNGVKFEPINY